MQSVIFDLDGTLIDSAPDIHAATNALLEQDGFAPLEFAQVKGFIGRGVPHLVACVLKAVGQDPDGPRHADMVARFEARYETAVDLTVTYPGVIEALDRLAALGLKLAICTNKPVAPTRAVLNHLGLTSCFSAIVGGDSLPVRKPDPAPLLLAISELGTSPDQIVYVGDSEVDAQTAQRAGVPFLLFTQGYRKSPVEQLYHTHAYDDFAAVPDLVANVLSQNVATTDQTR